VLFTLTWSLVFTLPFLLLAVAGFLLWRRRRSLATMLVLIGFAAMLLATATSLVESVEYSALVRAQPHGTFVVPHYHALWSVIHWAGLVGMWAASVGLVWHATQPEQ
jgi:MYXO-CTERM domain-containing protein